MNKILLIIQREYFSRVKKKSFIVMTLLVPILFVGMIGAVGYLAANQANMGDKKTIAVVDESGWFKDKLANTATLQFTYPAGNYETLKNGFTKSEDDYLLYIPQNTKGIMLFGKKKPSMTASQTIEERINAAAQAHRLAEAHIDSAVMADVQKPLHMEVKQLTDAGEKDAHGSVTFIIGMLCAVLIYMSLIMYGVQVMRGVIEEKVSRIVEVVISSVKPFQLMMGKILGVGLVGLTQFVLWIGITVAVSTFGGGLLMKHSGASPQTKEIKMAAGDATAAQAAAGGDSDMGEVMRTLNNVNIPYTVGCFLFYFLFGYLLYSALFAAVGSAVDSETETQQFIMPITLPLIFTFALCQSVIISNPDGALAVWLSIIPFTSPIAMMIRLQFGVPLWQLGVSMALLVAGFTLTVWVAGRIYRVGILMYGKKANYKELAKWFMYKD
jgi:ABC-2 type transport system permease protein